MSSPENIKIFTDSSSALPLEIAREKGIEIIRNKVIVGTEQYDDGVDITTNEFLGFLQDQKNLPTTSAPNLYEYQVAYGKHPESIISIHLGSYWSSVFGNAKIAGKMLNEDLGYEKITAYDTGTVTMGIGFMAIEAARLASEGQSKEEIVKKLDNMKERLTVVASLNTLKYLESGGRGHRIEGIRNLFGQVIGIKPAIKIDHNNMDVFKKCFSRDDALKTLTSFAKNYGTLERVGVMYGGDENDKQKAQQVLNNIKEFYKGDIYFGDIGTAVLRHAGPGAIGVVLVRKE